MNSMTFVHSLEHSKKVLNKLLLMKNVCNFVYRICGDELSLRLFVSPEPENWEGRLSLYKFEATLNIISKLP